MTIQRVLVAIGTSLQVVNAASIPSGATQLCSYGAPRPAAGTITPAVPVNIDSHGRVSFYVNGTWLDPFTKDDSPQGA